MTRFWSMILLASFASLIAGCGEDKPKAASGGGGSTTQATVQAPPKGSKPTME